jgi:hypothetical protein
VVLRHGMSLATKTGKCGAAEALGAGAPRDNTTRSAVVCGLLVVLCATL